MENKKSSDTLTSLSDSIVELAERLSSSVVGVQPEKMSGGSGIVWSEDGYIVTCYHVVKGFSEVQVMSDALGTNVAKVVGADRYSDVALLKIAATKQNVKPIELDESENRVGQVVLALANPFGEHAGITQGVITSSRTSVRGWWGSLMNNVVITDARLNPGYSGGPLVDATGRMRGMNAFYVASRGIAIRTSKVKSIVENLKMHGSIKRAYLGITSTPISLAREITDVLKIDNTGGLMVISVAANSPAKKAGILIGDIIVALDGKKVEGLHHIDSLLAPDYVGKAVPVSLIRGEKLIEFPITLGQSE
jgi:S1-C subfamily serine protease